MIHTFARLTEGQRLGQTPLEISPEDLRSWQQIAGTPDAAEDFHAPGLIAALMMRGYMQLLHERPQGNVHAQQTWHWTRPVPRSLTRLHFELDCQAKRLRNGKPWVHLMSHLRDETQTYVQAETRMVWAA